MKLPDSEISKKGAFKKVLLDSSVWVSFYTKDIHVAEAEKILNFVSQNKIIILMPTLVYVEVINILKRFKHGRINEIKNGFLNQRKIQIIHTNRNFWIRKVEKYMDLVKLKASDLLILTHAFEFKVEKFYTFDEKLRKAYNNLYPWLKRKPPKRR